MPISSSKKNPKKIVSLIDNTCLLSVNCVLSTRLGVTNVMVNKTYMVFPVTKLTIREREKI